MNKMKLLATALASFSFLASATSIQHHSHADIGVMNQESILYWLEKRGQLAKDATPAQRTQALKRYLGNKSFKPAHAYDHDYRKNKAHFLAKTTKGLAKSPAQLQQSATNDVETTVKVLAVMIDFQDLKHDGNNDIGSQDVSTQHYNDLVFSADRPQGLSAYQFYQQESGGTFFLTGQAYGWVTADHDAKHYGENDPDNNDNDTNPRELIIEAVTKAVAQHSIDLSEYDQTDLYDIDSDGIFNEPDGYIDHVMIFHGSIGEEAGGGSLGEDAIWAHSSSVGGVSIPGSNIKLAGYTINPIDAKAGVVSHEFGHDLGLPDEYDIESGLIGSPVGLWSLMAGGSWTNNGNNPSAFSPYALDYLSERYQGNWINQQIIQLDSLTSEDISLVGANNHQPDATNQIKVVLPQEQAQIEVGQPYSGEYQYYSNAGNMMDNRLSFNLDLPSDSATLTMTARWEIEVDYDYVQVLVNGTAIAGNHTKVDNPQHPEIHNFISANSLDLAEAQGELGWVDLSFDLSSYANQSVTIEITYITDPYEGGYGFVADNIEVATANNSLFSSGAEAIDEVTLNGFLRSADEFVGELYDHHYYIQLRNKEGNDSRLNLHGYQSGILLWYRNTNIEDNAVNNHPGEVFVGVVDADQHLIKNGQLNANTDIQVRDASFSLFDQSAYTGDSNLTNRTFFSDKDDYSSAEQPASGIKLPKYDLTMEVISQNSDSTFAEVKLAINGSPALQANIESDTNNLSVSFQANVIGGDASYSYAWDFGDGNSSTEQNPNHSYSSAGSYEVTLTVTDGAGATAESTTSITVTAAVVTPPSTGSSTSSSSGGSLGLFSLLSLLVMRLTVRKQY